MLQIYSFLFSLLGFVKKDKFNCKYNVNRIVSYLSKILYSSYIQIFRCILKIP